MRIGLASVVILFCATAAQAQIVNGDVLGGIGNGKVREFTPTGTTVQTLDTGTGSPAMTGMCRDQSGNLYATEFSNGKVAKFDPSGSLVNAAFITGLSNPESCTIDAAGEIYVGQAGAPVVVKYTTAGSTGLLLATFTLAVENINTDWIDLAADQCTLFYTSEGVLVKRFDVCTNTQLADFATLPTPTAYALRILPTGEVLVATSSAVYRLNTSGSVVKTYAASSLSPSPTGQLFAVNLDPDLTTFWTAEVSGGGTIYRVDLSSGAQVTAFPSGVSGLGGLLVYGEVTAAQASPIPALGAWGMLLLAGTLSAMAMLRLRVGGAVRCC